MRKKQPKHFRKNYSNTQQIRKSFPYRYVNIFFILLILAGIIGISVENGAVTSIKGIVLSIKVKGAEQSKEKNLSNLNTLYFPLYTSSRRENNFNFFSLGEQSVVGKQNGYSFFRSIINIPTQLTSATTSLIANGNIKTVFLIIMENANWSDVQGNPSAPYINNNIIPQSSYATQYYNPPFIHPSEPNYIWLEAGSNIFKDKQFLTDVDPSFANSTIISDHLTTLLSVFGISWKVYAEDIDGNTCPLDSHEVYAPKHIPVLFFQDVTNNNHKESLYCIKHVRPYQELQNDLMKNTVAQYTIIIPNLCNDMHDVCHPFFNRIKQGDSWLSHELPNILRSPSYLDGGLILITWDEGEGNNGRNSDGPIGFIALSPFAKGNGYTNTTYYTHSSTLKTLQEIFGIQPFLGDSTNANDLRDLFIPDAPIVTLSMLRL